MLADGDGHMLAEREKPSNNLSAHTSLTPLPVDPTKPKVEQKPMVDLMMTSKTLGGSDKPQGGTETHGGSDDTFKILGGSVKPQGGTG